MQNFRDLLVWRKAHLLVLAIYRATKKFPPDERFGMTSQLRRSAASIPANIAEGCGRTGNGELARFLQVAMGSASELDYHLELAHDLEYVKSAEYKALNDSIIEVKRMLASLMSRVDEQRARGRGAGA